jgi:CDP-diacylglycerol---serine O-phosphatidyltransferase
MSETKPATNQFLRQLIANGCTAANMASGLVSILCSSHGYLQYAALALLVSVVFDALDGHLARLLGVASEFGVQLDSLADMTSFVTAGSILSFYWFQGQCPVWLLGCLASLYLVLGGSRLARFNTGTKASDEFQGMPTTAMAVLLAMAYLNDPSLSAVIGVPAVALGAVLMVSNFPYPKFNKVLRLPKLVWPILLGYGILQPHQAIWCSIVSYVASGPVLGWIQSRQPKRDWVSVQGTETP